MASKSAAGFACRPNGTNVAGPVPGSCRSRRYLSESESDVCGTMKSLARLCSRDEDERASSLEELSQWVQVCLERDRPGSARLSKETLLHLLRLSHSCPLEEVRTRATELLQTAQVKVRVLLITKVGTHTRRNTRLNPIRNFQTRYVWITKVPPLILGAFVYVCYIISTLSQRLIGVKS